ncbi:MAG: hypothetical protein OHK0017_09300 [Patescibacteria group bacterium]
MSLTKIEKLPKQSLRAFDSQALYELDLGLCQLEKTSFTDKKVLLLPSGLRKGRENLRFSKMKDRVRFNVINIAENKNYTFLKKNLLFLFG